MAGWQVDAPWELRLPDNVRYTKRGLADHDESRVGPGMLVLALLGDGPPHCGIDDLAPVLRRFEPGARAILLLSWPVDSIPYHRLLGPLVDGRNQVIQVVPIEKAQQHRITCAVVIECVDKLAAPRPYLITADSASEPPDELRTVLRMANEWVLADVVARTARRRLIELEDVANQLADESARLRAAQRKIADLKASASLQIGQAFVNGLRHPVGAIITVPRDLARVWRVRRQSRRRGAGPAMSG